MKAGLIRLMLGWLLCALCSSAVWARVQGSGHEAPLTNASVIKLVRARFSEKTVIAIVRSRPTRFELSPERLIELKKQGVSEKIILAMLARQDGGTTEADLLGDSDDPFEADGAGAPKRGGHDREAGETGIFGSSGGARGSTRARGANGGVEQETQTTGSATVRILRPPAEAGGARALRMEKTPTLKNNSVVELVEAGFSEGTIIRRIEQSPVEFDLTPEKLADLRRRRVTEPVIAAMRAAMGEEATTQKPER